MSKRDSNSSGNDQQGHKPAVLNMSDFARRTGDRVCRELRAYWTGLRRGRAVPARADVDPRMIERTLEYAFILERIATGHARFRVAGMHLGDLMGMEVRGMPLGSFFVPEARETVARVLEQVFSGPEIAELTLAGEEGLGRGPLAARMLLLPLRSDLGDVSRILGCLIADGPLGRTPRRFAVSGTVIEGVIPGAQAATERLPAAPPPEPALTGMAEPAAPGPRPPDPDDTPESRRARFHLVT